jgi:predicted ATP-dependent serine protease
MSALDVVTALEPAPTVGPANLAAVMAELDQQSAHGDRALFQPLPTGFTPLDDVLNGGLRAGELLILGGAFGVGKTIFCLQAARNTVFDYPDTAAMYVCYEHDRAHLLLRMLCLESAETGSADSVLTLRRLASMAMEEESRDGLLSRLRESRAYAPVVAALDRYAPRLTLVKASGAHSTLAQLTVWANQLAAASPRIRGDHLFGPGTKGAGHEHRSPHHRHRRVRPHGAEGAAYAARGSARQLGASI